MIPAFRAQSYEFAEFVPARHYIGGEWRDSATSKVTQPVENPRSGKVMSTVQMGGADDVELAVRAAEAAYQDWKRVPIRDRAHVFYKLRELMMKNIDELAWLVSHENGKIFAEAKAEVEKGIECIEYGCSLPNLASGNQLEVSRGVACEVVYEPLGVVAGVVPFNFPSWCRCG
jgi:malonate-semialdehyde dehydrogenase (acetylating)/methylmalonate-semialdehyde dehydrogenase